MARAKNYETMSKFIKVMPRMLWLLFFRIRCSGRTYMRWIGWPVAEIFIYLKYLLTCNNPVHYAYALCNLVLSLVSSFMLYFIYFLPFMVNKDYQYETQCTSLTARLQKTNTNSCPLKRKKKR